MAAGRKGDFDLLGRDGVGQWVDPAGQKALSEQHREPAVARKGLLLVIRKAPTLGEKRQRVGERRRRLNRGRFLPERFAAPSGYVVHAQEVADAVRFGIALPVVLGELDGRELGVRHHRNKAIDLAVREVKVGPLERLDRDRSIADGHAIAHPWLREAPLPDRNCAL